MTEFKKLVYAPAGSNDATLAIAACRAGGIGILNGELGTAAETILSQLDFLSGKTRNVFGIKFDSADERLLSALVPYVHKGLGWLILDAECVPACQEVLAQLRHDGVQVLAETTASHWPGEPLDTMVDGLVLKGNESGGFVGENSSFILLQKWRLQTQLPLFVRGGMTPYVAAACHAIGVSGGVLDNQVLLLDESPFARDLRPLVENLSGNETAAVGDSEDGRYFRLLLHPGHASAKAFYDEGEGKKADVLRKLVQGKINWQSPQEGLLPIGQDVCFAGDWSRKYGRMAAVFRAIDAAVDNSLHQITETLPLSKNGPLAGALGIPLPLVQGPMSRVSDRADFAKAVAQGGALPMLALSLLKGKELRTLLQETRDALGERSWGIGLLGFAPGKLLDAQLAIAKEFRPKVAIIAGGRPDQAMKFEKAGILSFLHVPSAKLIPFFLEEGACRFIFEGRECGGHIGPLTGFVLWSTMVDCLLSELERGKNAAADIHVLFAGGIHSAVSSAMVQVLAAPLVQRGVKVGILMGSGYLFTKEIVRTGAIVPAFQKEVIRCEHTVHLESGPGHASRCCYTPFARSFLDKRRELRGNGIPMDEIRRTLDGLIMGRLRIATKGCDRVGDAGTLSTFDESYQQREGMYMVGQLATLRSDITDIPTLHREVTEEANKLLTARSTEKGHAKGPSEKPVDIAIVGMASLFPKANTTQDFWENILNRVDAITEIPSHRWDWRLYYDADRQARDKIYSKWGGFLDDLAFDPTQYGMPPKSIQAVDPMQLMALEVARRALADAGYAEREFDRERASVIVGASGGVGDVGVQYGLRAELPRFSGDLPDTVAQRLPEWTEDTFAGILLNVMAGRIANRLNLGGVNFTVDAACASSLAAIHQAVSELVAGRSSLVLAGGVDTVQGPFGYLCFSNTQALSPRGRCCTFDAGADGIVISEGVAMVVLKRLEDAQRDADRIYAVIKGVGGSSDGKAKGLTAPLPEGQLRAMRRAYEQAGFGPETVGLFEAHGTGTVVGDTAELESTTALLRESGYQPHQAAIGSVKTMIGHTKATAGVAGLIKATLALHHRVLPPHFGVNQPNQSLRQPTSPFYLVDEAVPWLPDTGHPRRAAVSAFGFGGTNFHVVLEEDTTEYRDWLRSAVTHRWPAELLLWRGNDGEDLKAQLTQTQQALENTKTLEMRDLAYNLARVCQGEGQTLAIVAADAQDLRKKIGAALNHLARESATPPPGIYHSDSTVSHGKVAVLFPGQGTQYIGMMRELTVHLPVVSEKLVEADQRLRECFSERFGKDKRLSHFIFPRGCYDEPSRTRATAALTGTDVAQPALGAIEAGLWTFFRRLGLKCHMFGGHSYGEFTALFAAGIIDFDTLMSISEARGRFIVDAAKESGAELGTMAAIQASREEVEKMISPIDGVVVANHNGPQQTIISGSTAAIREAVTQISSIGVLASTLPVAAAFHSAFVKPAQTALANVIKTAVWRDGKISVYSNTTGEPHASDSEHIKQAMTDHLVRPVEFLKQIEAMYRDGARVFLELGPKAVLTGLIHRILAERPHQAIAVDAHGGGITGLLHTMGELLTAGIPLDVMQLFAGRACIKGDPTDLVRMQRVNGTRKHAWLLNGSSVRRVTEPVKQVGVRLDEGRSPSTPPPQSPSPLLARSDVHLAAPQKLVPSKERKEEPQMVGPRQTPAAGEPTVMVEYFATMRKFLETQSQVMSMYMGGGSNGRRPGLRPPHHSQPKMLSENTEPEPYSVAPQADLSVQPQAPPQELPSVAAQTESTSLSELAKEPKVAEATSAPPSGGSATATAARGAIDRTTMTKILLTIVEEKTGYPPDMVGLEQNLEADLGIDSIKRVEIVGALLKALPPGYGQELGEDRAKLNTQSSLKGMLDLLEALKLDGSAPVPFSQTGMGSATDSSRHPFRHLIEPTPESIDPSSRKSLSEGHFLITQDTLGVAEELSELLGAQGCPVRIVERDTLKNDTLLNEFCASLETEPAAIGGILHLAPLGSNWYPPDASIHEWRSQLQINEKSLFLLSHHLIGRLTPDAHILSASGLGGLFHRNGANGFSGLSLQGGAVGMLKSLFKERPTARVKAVDVDPREPAPTIASFLMNELALLGGRQEVGYHQGQRTIFQTVPVSVDGKDERRDVMHNLVVLATGGCRGITAELLRELALPGNTLILTGRSPWPEDEPEALSTLMTPVALRQHFISAVRQGRLQLSPADIEGKVQSILAAREMRSNVHDFTQRGAQVEYQAVDVTDEDGMRQLLEAVYDRYAAVHGVIHGAGIIEDRLLPDKTPDSWSRVVETKVLGLLLLQKYLQPQLLSFFTVLSSVAGRYGNSGQTDYATANELMNRVCCQLRSHWGNQVNVKALCWGPWAATTFGAGMVTKETEAKFAENGVRLVRPEVGRQLFKNVLAHNDDTPVEIVCGEGPWEKDEAEIGRIHQTSENVPVQVLGPMLDHAALTTLPRGDKVITLHLGDNHRYLQDHRIDDVPVLPAAAALEIMSEAAGCLWPGWIVVEVRECRLLKGFELTQENQKLRLVVHPPTYGGSDGFEVHAAIQSDTSNGKQRIHYRSVLRLEQHFSNGFEYKAQSHTEQKLPVAKAYNEWLFHGPLFQVIQTITGLSQHGATALIRTTSPAQWLVNLESQEDQWAFDPAVVDAAAQMAILWARAFRNETALPSRFGRVVRYSKALPQELFMHFERIPSDEPHLVRANVYFSDANHNVLLMIEDMECVSSADLNRLGGTVKGNGKSGLSGPQEG